MRTFFAAMMIVLLAYSGISAESNPSSQSRISIDGLQIGMSRNQCNAVRLGLGRVTPVSAYPTLSDPSRPSISYQSRENIDQFVTIVFNSENQAAELKGTVLNIDDKTFRLGDSMESVVAAIGLPHESEKLFTDLSALFDQDSSFESQCEVLGYTGISPDKILTGESVSYERLGLVVTFMYVFGKDRIRREQLVLRSAKLVAKPPGPAP